jgi:hypothetical protein
MKASEIDLSQSERDLIQNMIDSISKIVPSVAFLSNGEFPKQFFDSFQGKV